MVNHFAKHTPDAPALCFAENDAPRTLSYAQFAEEIAVRAEGLRARGKTCLGVFADGSYPCVLEIFAAVRAGMQVVLLDENVPTPMLRGLLPYTDVDMLWGEEKLCAELAGNLTGGVRSGAGQVLFFTSGTTERSKAVVLTERSLCASAYNGGTLLPLAAGDTLLCMLPIGHVFGFVCGLLWGLSCGACVALGRGSRYYADDCRFFRPTAIALVPALLRFLLKGERFNEELRLMVIGAGECPMELLAAAHAQGIRVCFGYGLTETSSGVALSLGDEPYAMTICPDDTIQIAPDGEILINARMCMMRGYYKCPEETSAVLAGGVLNTGDLGHIDEKGRLYVTGRKKEVIVLPDGTKIFLPEAEDDLYRLLGDVDFALALRNERIVLVLCEDERSDAEIFALIEPYQTSRPRSQQIVEIRRRNEPLPRTANGKVKRWELVEP